MIISQWRLRSDRVRAGFFQPKSAKVLILLLVVAQLSRAMGGDGDPLDPALRATWQLRDQAAATDRARAAFGTLFDRAHAESAKLSILEGDRTPFLERQTNGRAVWIVRLADFDLPLRSPDGRKGKVIRKTFDICLDAEKGHLISITSPWPDTESFRLESLDPRAAEVQISRGGSEKHLGFVSVTPRISFCEALDILEVMNGMPSEAIQIVAQLVDASFLGQEARPFWVISFRGVSPHRPNARMSKRGRRFQYRSVLDAETGKLRVTTNSPDPVVVERDE